MKEKAFLDFPNFLLISISFKRIFIPTIKSNKVVLSNKKIFFFHDASSEKFSLMKIGCFF